MAEPSSSAYPGAIDTSSELGEDQAAFKTWTLDGNHSDSITTITVTETIGGISAPNWINIGTEIIFFEGISGKDFTTCTRGASDTTAAAHTDGNFVYHVSSPRWANLIVSALLAIQGELGVNPAGSFATVVLALAQTMAEKASAAGDTFYATGANATSALGIGNAKEFKRVNAAGDAPEWVAGATSGETTTGTEDGKPVTPDGFSGSDYGKRFVGLIHTKSDAAVATGDGTQGIPVPPELDSWNLVDVIATVHDKGVTGTTDIQVRRHRSGSDADLLSTKVTIGDEYQANDGVIGTPDLNAGDMLYFDVDAVHSGTAPNGLTILAAAQLP